MFLAVGEIAACIAVGLNTGKNPELLWQIFCAILICVFYTFGLMVMQNSNASSFWRTAALCYLVGFVVIFVVIVLLIISVLAEDGSPFETFGEFIGEGVGGMVDGGSSENRRGRKRINPIDPH